MSKKNVGNKHLKQLAESLDASFQTMPGLSDKSEKNDYMGILKESLIEFDKATTHKGPIEDLLGFSGEGELNTHKGVKGLVDILERAYFREDDILSEASDSDEDTLPVGEGPGQDKDSGTLHDPDEKDLGDVATKTADGQSSAGSGKASIGVDKPNAGSGGTGILPNPSAPDAQKNTIMDQDDSTSASKETALKFEASDLLQEEGLPNVETGENEPAGEDARKGIAPELGEEQDETTFEEDGEEKRGKMIESIFEGLDDIEDEDSFGEEETIDDDEEEIAGDEEEIAGDEEEIAGDEEELDALECLEAEDEEPLGEEEVAVEEPTGEEVGEEEVAVEEPTGEEELEGMYEEDDLDTGDEGSMEETPSDDSIDNLECLEEEEDEPESEEEKKEEEKKEEEVKTEAKKMAVKKKVVEKKSKAPAKKEAQKKSRNESLTLPIEELLEEEEETTEDIDLDEPKESEEVLPKPEATIGDDQPTGEQGQVGNVNPPSFNQGGAPAGQEVAAGEEDLDLSSEPEESIPGEEEEEMTPGEEDPLEIPAAGEEEENPTESLSEETEAPEEAPNESGNAVGELGTNVSEEADDGAAVIKNENGTIPATTETKFEQAVRARKQVEENIVERLIREMEGFSDSDDLIKESFEDSDDFESQDD